MLELGTDFSSIAQPKHMTIGEKDFYLDLLFYHRSLRRLVASELELGSLDAAYEGQMEAVFALVGQGTSAGRERTGGERLRGMKEKAVLGQCGSIFNNKLYSEKYLLPFKKPKEGDIAKPVKS